MQNYKAIIFSVIGLSCLTQAGFGQSAPALPDYAHSPLVKKILLEEKGYDFLKELTALGPRPNGSSQLEKAAQWAKKKSAKTGEKHLLALESDRGGFAPRGFLIEADSVVTAKARQLLQPAFQDALGCYSGYTIANISYLQSALMRIEYIPDDSRYFDLHHSDHDVLAEVNPREMTQGSAAIFFLIYCMDQSWKN